MEMRSLAIAVPVYKRALTPEEKTSLDSLFEKRAKVRPHADIYFVGASSVVAHFIRIYPHAHAAIFSEENFTSVERYNRFCLLPELYAFFSKYDYLCIFQTDCLLLGNDFTPWVQGSWDYVGAPWFQNSLPGQPRSDQNEIFAVGNGGFSLRKTKTFRNMFVRFHLLFAGLLIKKRQGLFGVLSVFDFFFLLLTNKKRITRQVIQYLDEVGQEDVFWSLGVPQAFGQLLKDKCWVKKGLFHLLRKDMKILDPHGALRFSFETFPETCWEQTQQQLPLGCHAWNTEEHVTFWEKIIPEQLPNENWVQYFKQ